MRDREAQMRDRHVYGGKSKSSVVLQGPLEEGRKAEAETSKWFDVEKGPGEVGTRSR